MLKNDTGIVVAHDMINIPPVMLVSSAGYENISHTLEVNPFQQGISTLKVINR